MGAWLALTGGIFMALTQLLVFFYAPIAAGMGITQKIFYFHLPLAWWALVSFFLVFAGSIISLKNKSANADDFCKACAELGVLFSGLALVSGMIWAKQAWGVWWTWDPRLTSTLVLWLIYCAYLVIGSLDMSPEKKQTVRAVIGIVAFLDVPLVFLSARMFRSAHPAVFASAGGGLEMEMKLTVFACIAAFGLFWLGSTIMRTLQLRQERMLNALLAEKI